MSENHEQAVRPEVFLDALLSHQAQVAGDIIEIEDHTWAIHGVIPVDGEVIMAEFARPEDAQAVLDRLGVAERGVEVEWPGP